MPTKTMQERLGKALQQLGGKNDRYSEREVAEDVRKAIAEVRADANNEEALR